jgi:hypothetical protein
MTVENIKNILKMTQEIMDLISKYFPAELNKQFIDMLSSMSEEECEVMFTKFSTEFNTKVDYTGVIKILKGLDGLYKESPNIANFAERMQDRNMILKLISCVI